MTEYIPFLVTFVTIWAAVSLAVMCYEGVKNEYPDEIQVERGARFNRLTAIIVLVFLVEAAQAYMGT